MLLLFVFAFGAHAQPAAATGKGKITGHIIDSASGQPVEFASVSLALQDNGKEINGTTTDDKGEFKLTNIADGTYKLLIYSVGYRNGIKNNIVISATQSTVALGAIKLASTTAKLNEVTVNADKNVIENRIDKMVYNVANDITSQGGVATDVLRKVPEVTVDVDGNVELQRNANIRFLINGKPSTIFGNDLADVLQSIPASQIESIEVITSPGAKYDGAGTGGIINIILKKNTSQGVNGSLSLSGGTRLENSSIELNARKGSFGVNAFFSGDAHINATTVNIVNRLGQDSGAQTTRLIENGTSQFSRGGYQSGLGFNWDITPKDNITATIGYDFFEHNNPGTNNRETIIQDASGNTLSDMNDVVNTSSNFHEQSLDWSAAYKRTFAQKDRELDISYNSSNGNNYAYYLQTDGAGAPETVYSGSYGNDPGIENETDIMIDYTQPAGKGVMLEMGGKTELDKIQSTSDVYLLNTATNNYDYNNSQSSAINYTDNIYAGYFSGDFKLFNYLEVKAGFRYEYTQINAWFSNSGNAAIPPYSTYFPSLTIAHKYTDNQTIKLSYSHRIERPDYKDLNPFIDASDPKNVTTGNEDLKPEVGNKIELGYSKIFDKGASIFLTLFYRWNINDIQWYTLYYPTYQVGDSVYTNVAVNTRENIGREDNIGLNLFGNIPIGSKIKLLPQVMLFQRYINTGLSTGGNISGFNYRTSINATYNVSSTLTIEVFGKFNAPMINAEGTKPAYTIYTFALRKQLFHKKGSIALTAANPFDKYINLTTSLTGDNFTSINTREIPYRSFGFNFTYRFGSLKTKKEKAHENTVPEPPTDEGG